jgi:2-amino-4-hydroxy-6-hydroxymethyldihydropteridine diphosphokinase
MTPTHHVRTYLSLGANLGDRAKNLGRARASLLAVDGIRMVSCSAVAETTPVDYLEQPDFLNQVIGLDTTLEPRQLLETCLKIEQQMGRDRESVPRGGPRTIDIDILLYGDIQIDAPGLTIPHPRLAQRTFFIELCRQVGVPAAQLPELPPSHVEAQRQWA